MVDKFISSGHPSGKLAPNFHEAETREVLGYDRHFFWGMKCMWGLYRCSSLVPLNSSETQFSELLHLSWGWPWDGSQSCGKLFLLCLSSGGRLWLCGHCWRNQDDGLNSVAHSWPFPLIWCSVGCLCIPVHTFFYICVHFREKAKIQVSGTLGFRSLTSWVIIITSSIFSFLISKVGKPPNLAIMRVTWNKIWRVLGHSPQWISGTQ